MRFLVDECCAPVLVEWLRERGYDVKRVADTAPGLEDADVLVWAQREKRVLVTSDKDFGARIFGRGESHGGVILLRADDERPPILVKILASVLDRFGEKIEGRFIVGSEQRIRPSA